MFDSFRDFRKLRKAMADPSNADKYLLSDEQRVALEEGYADLEKQLFAIDDEDAFKKLLLDREGPMAKVFSTLDANPVFSPFLINWSYERYEDIMQRVLLAKDIKMLYEAAPKGTAFFHGEIPKEPKFRAWIKGEGKRLYTKDYEFPNLRSVSSHESGLRDTVAEIAVKGKGEIGTWDGNYLGFSKRILSHAPYRVLFTTRPEIPEHLTDKIASTAFIEAYLRPEKHGGSGDDSDGSG